MAVENVTSKSYVSHSQTRSATDDATNTGDGTEVYDNDFGTNYGVQSHRVGGGAWTTAICTSEHTWTTAITASKIKVYVYSAGQADGDNTQVNNTVYVDLKISGAWTRIVTNGDSGSSTPTTKIETTLNAEYDNSGDGWADVTGIRSYSKGSAYDDGENVNGWAYAYELQCFKTILKTYGGTI